MTDDVMAWTRKVAVEIETSGLTGYSGRSDVGYQSKRVLMDEFIFFSGGGADYLGLSPLRCRRLWRETSIGR